MMEITAQPTLSGMPDKRFRRTQANIDDLKNAILDVVAGLDRLTVRHLFYVLVSKGVIMPADVIKRIKHYAPAADIRLNRVAVDREQVRLFNLPTRPTKRDGNRHAAGFEGESVEVDAMPPDILKDLLRFTIEQYMDRDRLRVLRAAEESERDLLRTFGKEGAS